MYKKILTLLFFLTITSSSTHAMYLGNRDGMDPDLRLWRIGRVLQKIREQRAKQMEPTRTANVPLRRTTKKTTGASST